MMSNQSIPGEVKIKLLLAATLPQLIENLIRNFNTKFGCEPDQLVITTGIHRELTTFPEYLKDLDRRFTLITTFVPSKKAADNAVVVVCNASGSKYLYI